MRAALLCLLTPGSSLPLGTAQPDAQGRWLFSALLLPVLGRFWCSAETLELFVVSQPLKQQGFLPISLCVFLPVQNTHVFPV